MKTILKFMTLSLVLPCLFSCDPSHDVIFTNQTDANAKVKIEINNEAEKYRFKEGFNEDSIVYNLKPKDTADIYFGIGTWSDEEVSRIVNSIEKIEVETKDIKTVYKSKKSITQFLKDNRKGLWMQTNIEIDIK